MVVEVTEPKGPRHWVDSVGCQGRDQIRVDNVLDVQRQVRKRYVSGRHGENEFGGAQDAWRE
jgi:hypothetical protein